MAQKVVLAATSANPKRLAAVVHLDDPAIRRVELANLITLSEGIRTETDPDVIRNRLIPVDVEALHV